MRNFKKLSQVEVEVVTPWVAVPIPRLVSKLKLEVMSSCLVRQGREVKAGIASLQANLPDSEARIKGTYKNVSMQQPGYCLHTKLVHEVHYWAHLHYR